MRGFCFVETDNKANTSDGIKDADSLLCLDSETIEKVKKEAVAMVKELLKEDIKEIILYGSCARNDYCGDSDIDIALIMGCGRLEAKKYGDDLAFIATRLAMKYFVVVNFVCLPEEEYRANCSWYAYFRNIREEGVVLYGG